MTMNPLLSVFGQLQEIKEYQFRRAKYPQRVFMIILMSLATVNSLQIIIPKKMHFM